jgi:hypothetical protein
MIGLFWNIRSLGKTGRQPALANRVRDNHVDIIGIVETKRESFSPGFLKNLNGNTPYSWFINPAKGSPGGMLIGVSVDLYVATLGQTLDFSISIMLLDRKSGFSWKLVVVYGSPYEEGKQPFLDEIHNIMSIWQGPTVVVRDFNLVRLASDKSNGVINHKWADAFNIWVSTWNLIELNPSNKRFTWTNNQENLVMAKIDRVFVSTDWEAAFPLASVKALDRPPSDHNPLLLNVGDNMHFGKKKFRFEKLWLEKAEFKDIMTKAWERSDREKIVFDE